MKNTNEINLCDYSKETIDEVKKGFIHALRKDATLIKSVLKTIETVIFKHHPTLAALQFSWIEEEFGMSRELRETMRKCFEAHSELLNEALQLLNEAVPMVNMSVDNEEGALK